MVIDTYKDYVVRTGTPEDVQAMYDILEPLVCDKTRHKFQYATQQRKLKMNIEYYLKKQCLVVEKLGEVVGVYLGEDSFIVHMAYKHTYVKARALLMYNTLCKMHGRFAESCFIPLEHKGAYKFSTRLFGEGGIRVEDGIWYINVYAKDRLEQLYTTLKGNV